MPQSKTGSQKQKRHFTAVVGKEEQGLYNSYNPSSAARKAVSKLCANDKKSQVEFFIRETTQGSNKKTYGPYLGYVKKLKEPIQLEGRVIKYAPVVKLSKNVEEGKLSSRKLSKKLDGGAKRRSKRASKKTSKKGSRKGSRKASKNSKIMRGGNRLVRVIKLNLREYEITVEDVVKEKKYIMNIRYMARGGPPFYFRIPGDEERICTFSEVYEDVRKTNYFLGQTSELEEKLKGAMPNLIVEQSAENFDKYFANKHYTVEVDFKTLKVIPGDMGAYYDWNG